MELVKIQFPNPSVGDIMQEAEINWEYLELYLIHWPISVKPVDWETPYTEDLITTFDLRGVWKGMEECQKLGLAKSIGVSNFTCKKLEDLLSFATIPPSVNQVGPWTHLGHFSTYINLIWPVLTKYSIFDTATPNRWRWILLGIRRS